MTFATFTEKVTSDAALREIIDVPNEMIRRKQLAALDKHCQEFIALSPFLLISSTNAAGEADVSPRGDPPGFVQVLDEKTLVIPERPGNRRIDTLRNIVQQPHVGLLFLIPGQGETLRVNGQACIIRDSAVLERCIVEGKRPLLAIAVSVDECFLHCSKSIRRAKLWEQEPRKTLASIGQIMIDHTGVTGVTAQQLDETLKKDIPLY
jgi:PPOX class probable FMN-dependent enzyme